MKTKEIIERAQLTKGFNKKLQGTLFDLMLKEVKDIYEGFGVKDSERHFIAAVKMLRQKWDAVSKKIPFGIPEGIWKFFYAVRIVPLKEKLCPTWKMRNDAWQRKKEVKQTKKETVKSE